MPADETKEEEKNRFQMVTIDINGEKKDLEVESFNLPQPVFIEKVYNCINNMVNKSLDYNVNNKTNLLRFSHICNVGDHLYLKCLHPVCYALSPYEDDIILNA
jgi:hypothetical protein